MDFLFFFLGLREQREGKVQLQSSGRFRVLIPSKNVDAPVIERMSPKETMTILQVRFPTFFNRGRVGLEVSSSDDHFDQRLEGYWTELTRDLENWNLRSPIEPRGGRWCDLKLIEVPYLLRAMRSYSLKKLFQILAEISPVENGIEYFADLNIPKYKEDTKQKLLSSIVEFERRFTSKRTRKKLRKVKERILKQGDAYTLVDALQKIGGEELRETEKDVEFLYISRGIEDNLISQTKPKKEIKFKLWERNLEDLFTGNYSGTCIALDEGDAMPSYLNDPYTEFFRILVNERRIGHVKMFYCTDEDGEDVLHTDYIGLSGGRFKPLQDEIKKYAITASIRLAQIKGQKRVYVAREVVPDLDGRLTTNRLIKKGRNIYSQYLDADKFLVWERPKVS